MAGVKTQLVKQAVVRYIREERLGPGKRLPVQEELRRQLGFGSATIMAAIHELRADGVVEVRDKVGVFVVDPDTDGHAGREIGLAVNAVEVSAFRSCLSNLIQIRLADRGWRAIPFFCLEPNLSGQMNISAFPGLRRSVKQKKVDALVTLGEFSQASFSFLRAQKLPVVYVGSRMANAARVRINMPGVLRAALARLRDEGLRRPGLLLSEALRPLLEPEFAAAGGAPEMLFSGTLPADGVAAAERFLSLPEAARPDAMVVFDDMLATGFIAQLHRRRAPARPRMVILNNRQNPMDFAVDDPLIFDVDLNALAALTAELLQRRFKGDTTDDELTYTPKWLDARPL